MYSMDCHEVCEMIVGLEIIEMNIHCHYAKLLGVPWNIPYVNSIFTFPNCQEWNPKFRCRVNSVPTWVLKLDMNSNERNNSSLRLFRYMAHHGFLETLLYIRIYTRIYSCITLTYT